MPSAPLHPCYRNGMFGKRSETPPPHCAELEARATAVADGSLQLRIEHTYSLAEAAQAHRDLEARQTTGKLLLLP